VTGGLSDRLAARSHFGAVARGIDHAVFHGDGIAEPLGIVNVPGVGSVVGTTFAIASAAQMLGLVETGNANADSVSWAMSPDVAEILRQRPKVSGGERMLYEDGKILDRPAFVSNSIDAGTIFCGDFTQVIVMVKDIELLIDKSTGSISGLTNILCYPFLDIIVTRPASFAVAQGVS